MMIAMQERSGGDDAAGWNAVSVSQDMRLAADWLDIRRARQRRPFHLAQCIRFHGQPDIEYLERAINQVIDRHSALRTTFEDVMCMQPSQTRAMLNALMSPDGWRKSLFKHRVSKHAQVSVGECRLAGALSVDSSEFRDVVHREVSRPLASQAPLIRVNVLRSSNETALLTVCHHLVADGFTLGLLSREIGTAYGRLSAGETAASLPAVHQYSEFVAWQRERLLAPGVASVVSSLQEAFVTDVAAQPSLVDADAGLAIEHARSGVAQGNCSSRASERIEWHCRREGVTPYALWLAALYGLCHLVSGAQRIGIWVVWANRRQPWAREMAGWLSERRLVGIDIDPRLTGREWVRVVHERICSEGERQEIPAGAIEHIMWRMPASRVRIGHGVSLDMTYRTSGQRMIWTGSLATSVMRLPFTSRETGVKLYVRTPPSMGVDCTYPADEMSESSARMLLARLMRLVLGLVQRPERELGTWARAL